MSKKQTKTTEKSQSNFEIANGLVARFAWDPYPVLEELKDESPYVRLRFLMKARRAKNRDVAQAAGINECYLSRCVSSGSGLDRGWQAISNFFGVSREWLIRGSCDDSPQELVKVIKGETKVQGKSFVPLLTPANRRVPTWARNVERLAIPIRIGEDAFGFEAGSVLWTEECTNPQLGDRIIAEMNDGQFEAFVMFLPGFPPMKNFHTGFPPELNWADTENLRAVKTIPLENIKKLFLVVGSRDRPLRIRTANEIMGAAIEQAGMLAADDDLEDGDAGDNQ